MSKLGRLICRLRGRHLWSGTLLFFPEGEASRCVEPCALCGRLRAVGREPADE